MLIWGQYEHTVFILFPHFFSCPPFLFPLSLPAPPLPCLWALTPPHTSSVYTLGSDSSTQQLALLIPIMSSLEQESIWHLAWWGCRAQVWCLPLWLKNRTMKGHCDCPDPLSWGQAIILEKEVSNTGQTLQDNTCSCSLAPKPCSSCSIPQSLRTMGLSAV